MPTQNSFDTLNLKTFDPTGTFWDTHEADKLNETIIKTVVELRRVSNALQKASARLAELSLNYKQKLRESYISVSERPGITESYKKALAENAVEDLEFQLCYYEELVAGLKRQSQVYKDELDILKTLSYNIRQEMKL